MVRVTIPRLAVGALGGAAATLPMSAVMFGAQKLGVLPVLPPEHITHDAMSEAGIHLDEGSRNVLSTISHVAYGAASGAVYGAVVPTGAQGVGTGIAFGVGVYAGSYLGLLPALGLDPPDRGGRTPGAPPCSSPTPSSGPALGAIAAKMDAE